MQPTSHKVVLKLIEEINPAKSAGIDKIGGRFLKDGATALASPIKNVCNLTIKLSKLSDACKIALLDTFINKRDSCDMPKSGKIDFLDFLVVK